MRLKYKFEFVELDDELVCVPVGEGAEKVHAVLKINKSAREILEMLENEISEQEIVSTLALKYTNEPETLKKYVFNMVSILKEKNLIEE